jgi:hypothetical protein
MLVLTFYFSLFTLVCTVWKDGTFVIRIEPP